MSKRKASKKNISRKKPAKKGARGRPNLQSRLANTRFGKSRWGKIAYWGAVAGVWLMVGIGLFAAYLAHDLPNLRDLPRPDSPRLIEVRAEDGALLARYGGAYGEWLEFEDIPPVMPLALIAIEDRRFFRHKGLDYRGLARAMWQNLRAGSVRQGGSTLSQQLIKNLFLTHTRTAKRKVQEVLVTFWLEQRFSKTEILELYLNRIYFGSGAYGIDAASRKFFGHSARRLSVREAAMLAGLVQAPTAYAPTRSPEAATRRMKEVLAAMSAVNYLNPGQAEAASAGPPRLAEGVGNARARHFTDWARDRAVDLAGQSDTPLVVTTTLDSGLQRSAANALRTNLAQRGPGLSVGEGAVIVLASDGAIRTLVGGRDYGKSQFNRAIQARRQPGSTFKLFVYLAALESGMRPGDMFEDGPFSIEGWSPRNFSGAYAGPMTLETAFSKSVNTVAVQVSERVGRDEVKRAARRLGITSDIPTHPSIALGAADVSPLEITSAYAAVASGGYAVEPYGVLEVQSLSGEVLYRRPPVRPKQVMRLSVAEQLAEMMQETVATGTGRAARLDRPTAGKTGTSQDYRDAWFIGFTGDLTASVWLGNDNGAPTQGVTGGALPAQVWAQVMRAAHLGRPPSPLLSEPTSVAFPRYDDPNPQPWEEPEKPKKKSFLERLFGRN